MSGMFSQNSVNTRTTPWPEDKASSTYRRDQMPHPFSSSRQSGTRDRGSTIYYEGESQGTNPFLSRERRPLSQTEARLHDPLIETREKKTPSSTKGMTRLRKDLERRLGALSEMTQKLLSHLEKETQKSENWKNTVEILQETITGLQNSNKKKDTKLKSREQALVDAQKQHRVEVCQLSHCAETAELKAEDLQRQLETMKQQFNETKELLEKRTTELQEARNNGPARRSTLFRRELKEMVESFNQEILQTSSTIVDSLDFKEPSRKRLSKEERDRILPQLEGHLPRTFLSRLARHRPLSDDADEELGVQVALQATVAKIACFYAQTWCPSNGQLSHNLKEIYDELHKSDSFAARQWRSTTHSQVRKRTLTQDIQTIDAAIRNSLVTLLNVCGWTDEYISNNDRHSQAIDESLGIIADKIMQLNEAIFEDPMHYEARLLWHSACSRKDIVHNGPWPTDHHARD